MKIREELKMSKTRRTTLSERLRCHAKTLEKMKLVAASTDCRKAADELERMQNTSSELARLQKALNEETANSE